MRQGLKREARKGGGRRAAGAAERPEEAPIRDYMLPTACRPRTCSGKPDGEHREPERPNKNYNIIDYNLRVLFISFSKS